MKRRQRERLASGNAGPTRLTIVAALLGAVVAATGYVVAPVRTLAIGHAVAGGRGSVRSAVLLATAGRAAGEYQVPWYTIDGGGVMFATGGGYEVGGTIGQPDAGTLSGGGYAVNGGFWSFGPACAIADPPTKPPGEAGYDKVRYISMEPGNPGQQTALRVTLTTLPPPFSGLNDTKCWVSEPQQVSENSGNVDPIPDWPNFMSANLQGSPHCMNWSTVGILHVTDDDIIPSAVYEVQAIDCECDFENEANYSAPLTITTSKWGDLVGHCAVIPCTPPEGVVNMATDVTACLDKFRNLAGAVLKSRADIEPNFPDWLINISDVAYVLDAFRGFAYPPAQTPPATAWPTGPDGCP